jgi:protein TonB
VDAEAQELRISQAVRQHLQAHFEYPWLARKRNWQGDVLLTLHIERDGRLSRVALDTSSGYPALDRSALESAQRIGRIPEAGRWLGDAGYDLILPVRYRLTDG